MRHVNVRFDTVKKPVGPEMIKVGNVLYPKKVKTCSKYAVDLCLPHSCNPFLKDEKSPLHDMKRYVLQQLKNPGVAHIVMLGSSGVGKTAVAYMIAQKRWCIYIEASASSTTYGYQLELSDLNHNNRDRSKPKLVDVVRRVRREILARGLVLLGLKNKFKNTTPYKALLFQLSSQTSVLNKIRMLIGSGYDKPTTTTLLDFVSEELGKLTVILDEAHMFNWNPAYVMHVGNKAHHVNDFQAFLLALDTCSLAGTISAGTQVGLAQASQVLSIVAKSEHRKSCHVIGTYPILGGFGTTEPYSVAKSLSACIEIYPKVQFSIRVLIEDAFQGRPRLCADFIQRYLETELRSTSRTTSQVSPTQHDPHNQATQTHTAIFYGSARTQWQ